MVSIRRSLLLALGAFLTIFVVACGSSNTGINTIPYSANATTPSASATVTTRTDMPAVTQNNNSQQTANTTQTQNNNNQQNNNQASGNQQNNNQGQMTAQDNNQNKQNQGTTQSNQDKTAQGSSQDNQNDQSSSDHKPATTSGTSKTVLKTQQVTINGQTVTVLTTFDGMTLYQRTSDPAPASTCTHQCAQTWPPLLSNGTVFSTTPIKGNLTVQTTANGNQVEFNGHPLYTYSGDTAPGQANGQGAGMVWQAITINLAPVHW